jgi:hypothetical protein
MLLALLWMLTACASTPPQVVVETQEVRVPVPVRATPPPALAAPYRPAEVPVWLAPGAAEATSCLDARGERALLAILYDLVARESAWWSWSMEPLP